MKTINRIEYIDALRGFTILLVVFVHIETFSFSNQVFLWSTTFKFFRMPLFFFISGYIAFKSKKVWDAHTFLKEICKKLRIQLVPTFLFGLTFTYLFQNGNIQTFIMDTSKNGYWFTLVLLEMFIIYFTTNYILYKCKKAENDHSFFIAMLYSILGVYLIKIMAIYNSSVNEFMTITSFHYVPIYFPHFIFGVLVAKYKHSLRNIIEHTFFMAGILFIFSIVLVFRQTIIENIIGGKILSAGILSFSGIIIVFNIFRKYQASFTNSTKLGRILQYIGKRTLDIYLLHYFFLPYIPKINILLGITPNLVMELIGFLLAFLVIGCCIITSNIIRLSDFLGYWLFGAKNRSCLLKP